MALASATSRDATVKLVLKADAFLRQAGIAGQAIGEVGLAVVGLAEKLDRVRVSIGKVSLSLAGISAAKFSAGVAVAGKFEQAFANVRKTVEGTETEFENLSDGIRKMSREMPVAAGEIANLASVAGQLGVAKNQILEFTEVAAKLGVATELSSTQAIVGLSRMMNLMGEAQSNVSRLGGSLVHLGNVANVTEGPILDFALNIAGTANAVGVASEEVLGIATSFAEAGVQAEAGGTAVQKTMLEISKAATTGGGSLIHFADALDMTQQEFARLARDDPTEAFVRFIETLREAGPEAIRILNRVDLDDQRLIRALLNVANSATSIRQRVKQSRDEFAEDPASNALAEETQKRFDTLFEQMKTFRNIMTDTLRAIGLPFLNALTNMMEVVNSVAGAFARLVDFLRPVIKITAPIVTLLLTAVGVFATLELKVLLAGLAFKLLGRQMRIAIRSGIAGGLKNIAAAIANQGSVLETLTGRWRVFNGTTKELRPMARFVETVFMRMTEAAGAFGLAIKRIGVGIFRFRLNEFGKAGDRIIKQRRLGEGLFGGQGRLSTALDNVASAADEGVNKAYDAAAQGNRRERFKAWVKSRVSTLTDTAASAMDQASGKMRSTWDGYWNSLTESQRKGLDTFFDKTEKIENRVRKKFNDVIVQRLAEGASQTEIDDLIRAQERNYTRAFETYARGPGGLADKARGAADDVVGFASGLVGQARERGESVRDTAKNAGKSFGQGMRDSLTRVSDRMNSAMSQAGEKGAGSFSKAMGGAGNLFVWGQIAMMVGTVIKSQIEKAAERVRESAFDFINEAKDFGKAVGLTLGGERGDVPSSIPRFMSREFQRETGKFLDIADSMLRQGRTIEDVENTFRAYAEASGANDQQSIATTINDLMRGLDARTRLDIENGELTQAELELLVRSNRDIVDSIQDRENLSYTEEQQKMLRAILDPTTPILTRREYERQFGETNFQDIVDRRFSAIEAMTQVAQAEFDTSASRRGLLTSMSRAGMAAPFVMNRYAMMQGVTPGITGDALAASGMISGTIAETLSSGRVTSGVEAIAALRQMEEAGASAELIRQVIMDLDRMSFEGALGTDKFFKLDHITTVDEFIQEVQKNPELRLQFNMPGIDEAAASAEQLQNFLREQEFGATFRESELLQLLGPAYTAEDNQALRQVQLERFMRGAQLAGGLVGNIGIPEAGLRMGTTAARAPDSSIDFFRNREAGILELTRLFSEERKRLIEDAGSEAVMMEGEGARIQEAFNAARQAADQLMVQGLQRRMSRLPATKRIEEIEKAIGEARDAWNEFQDAQSFQTLSQLTDMAINEHVNNFTQLVQLNRAEQDMNDQRSRAVEDHNKQMSRLYRDRARQERDRNEQMAQQADVTQRIFTRRTRSRAFLLTNMERQNELFKRQQQGLSQLRAMGMDEGMIKLLGLDQGPESAFQIERILRGGPEAVADFINQMNSMYGDRISVVDQMFGESREGQEEEQRFQERLDDIATAWARATADFEKAISRLGENLLEGIKTQEDIDRELSKGMESGSQSIRDKAMAIERDAVAAFLGLDAVIDEKTAKWIEKFTDVGEAGTGAFEDIADAAKGGLKDIDTRATSTFEKLLQLIGLNKQEINDWRDAIANVRDVMGEWRDMAVNALTNIRDKIGEVLEKLGPLGDIIVTIGEKVIEAGKLFAAWMFNPMSIFHGAILEVITSLDDMVSGWANVSRRIQNILKDTFPWLFKDSDGKKSDKKSDGKPPPGGGGASDVNQYTQYADKFESSYQKVDDDASVATMARDALSMFGGRISSTYRSGNPKSHHADRDNPAHDISLRDQGHPPEVYNQMFDYLRSRYGSNIRQMIYGTRNFRYGKVSKWPYNDHWDHLHLARDGMIATRPTVAGIGEFGSEAVIPLDGRGIEVISKAFQAAMPRAFDGTSGTGVFGTTTINNTMNEFGPITVQAQDPNEMARKLREQKRLQALTRPAGARNGA